VVPGPVYELLMQYCHIPTGVVVSSLQYPDPDDSKTMIETYIVGDPTMIGAILNDPSRLPQSVNPKTDIIIGNFAQRDGLELEDLPQWKVNSNTLVKPGKKGNGGLKLIPHDYVFVQLQPTLKSLKIGKEIFVKYEEKLGEFWKYRPDDRYCEVCMSKESPNSNLLILCNVMIPHPSIKSKSVSCICGCHVNCLPARVKKPQNEAEIKLMQWSCRIHINTLSRGSSRIAHKSDGPPDVYLNYPTRSAIRQITESRCDAEKGLVKNSVLLNVSVQKSSIDNAGLGLFTTKAVAPGTTVGYFFGLIISRTRYDRILSGRLAPEDEDELEFLEDYKKGICRSLDISQSFSDHINEYIMLVSRQCPAGYINDPRLRIGTKARVENCQIVYPMEVIHKNCLLPYRAFPVLTKSALKANTELFFTYHGYDPSRKSTLREPVRKVADFYSTTLFRELQTTNNKPKLTFNEKMKQLQDSENTLSVVPPIIESTQPAAVFMPPYSETLHMPSISRAAVLPSLVLQDLVNTKPAPQPSFTRLQNQVSPTSTAQPVAPSDSLTNRRIQSYINYPSKPDVGEPQTQLIYLTKRTASTLENLKVAAKQLPKAKHIEKRTSSVLTGWDPAASEILRSASATAASPGLTSPASQPSVKIHIDTARDSACVAPEESEVVASPQRGPQAVGKPSFKLSSFVPQDCHTPMEIDPPCIPEIKQAVPLPVSQEDSFNDGCNFDAIDAHECDDIADDQTAADAILQDALDEDEIPEGEQDQMSDEDSNSGSEHSEFLGPVTHSTQESIHESAAASALPAAAVPKRVKRLPVHLRTKTQTAKLPHFSIAPLSPFQEAYVRKKAKEFLKEKPKCEKTEDELMSSRGALSLVAIPADYAEVLACCYAPDLRLNLPDDHPFSSFEKFMDCRVLIHSGNMMEGGNKQGVMQYLANRTSDPEDATREPHERKYRVILLSGHRSCESCFRALHGQCRTTMFTMHDRLKNGVSCVTDFRTKPDNSSLKIIDLVVHGVKDLIDEMGEPIPNAQNPNRHFQEVPFTQVTELRDKLSKRMNMEVKSSTLRRAVQAYESKFNVHVSLAKIKRFMKCSTCTRLHNDKKAAKTEEEKKARTVVKNNHFRQVGDQRQNYHDQRDLAKEKPEELMVLVIDGMDQAKTTLPHQVRTSKDTDGPGLGVHVVSVFMFGGDLPILGFLNLQDITKNSSLTVVNIHRAIELQFEKIVQNNNCQLARWPKRLHICFDNAVGENINQNVFGYLAALVHHGVFQEITIGTLFVGHTHNINDQLFSVWSRWLRFNECITISKMMEKFQETYKGYSVTSAVKKKLDLDGDVERKQVEEEKKDSDGDGASVISSVYMRIPQDFSKPLQTEMKQSTMKIVQDIEDAGTVARPFLERVKHNIDVEGWLNLEEKIFEGILKYHIFTFAKNKSGETEMFMKFETKSEVRYPEYRHEEVHNGVKYRTRRIIFKSSKMIDKDPITMPLNKVDTAGIIDLLKKIEAEDRSNVEKCAQIKEMTEVCKSLTTQYENQGIECSECLRINNDLKAIGTISKPARNADAKVKVDHNKKSNRRKALQLEQLEHMQTANHSAKVGWWTDWLKIRIPLIREYYQSKGLQVAADSAETQIGMTGYLQHPKDEHEGDPAFRVENQCMGMVGQPAAGMYVLTRIPLDDLDVPPFWVARIKRYFSPSPGVIEFYQKLLKMRQKRYNENKQGSEESDSRMPTPPSDLNLDSPEAAAEKKPNEKSKKSGASENLKSGKDKLQEVSNPLFDHSHVIVHWWSHVSSREKAQAVNSKKRKHVKAEATESSSASVASPSKRPKRVSERNATKVNYAETAASSDQDSEMQDRQAKHDEEYQLPHDDTTLETLLEAPEPSGYNSKLVLKNPFLEKLSHWRYEQYFECPEKMHHEAILPVNAIFWWGTEDMFLQLKGRKQILNSKTLPTLGRFSELVWKQVIAEIKQQSEDQVQNESDNHLESDSENQPEKKS